jgi:hypothetical protein
MGMMRRLCALGLLVLMVGCRRPAAVPAIEGFVQRYLELCVALGERDTDSLDFYVGPAGMTAHAREEMLPTAEIGRRARALRSEIEAGRGGFSASDKTRAEFLSKQLDALRLRTEMLAGKTVPMDQEAAVEFGTEVPADHDADVRAKARAGIARLVGGVGARRYSEYERGFVVPPGKVPVVMEAALGACKAATLEHVQLPAGEHVEVRYVSHQPWSGFSRYLGRGHSVIQINMDFPLTVDEILGLACHEGYPGHHVFNTLREQALVERLGEREWSAQPTFSPQSFVSEAAASYAVDVALPAEERLRVERDVLFPIAGIDSAKAARYMEVARLVDVLGSAESGIAKEYLDGRLEYARANEALEREMLMEHGDALLLYLNEFRGYMVTYTVGKDAVGRMVEAGSPTETTRWERYVALMRGRVWSLGGPQRDGR